MQVRRDAVEPCRKFYFLILTQMWTSQQKLTVWNVRTDTTTSVTLGKKKEEFDHRWSPCGRYIIGVNKSRIRVRDSNTLAVHSTIHSKVGADWLLGSHDIWTQPSLITIRKDNGNIILHRYTYPSIHQCRRLLLGVFLGRLRTGSLYGFPRRVVEFFGRHPGLKKLVGGKICSYMAFRHDRSPTSQSI